MILLVPGKNTKVLGLIDQRICRSALSVLYQPQQTRIFLSFRAALPACGSSQSRGKIGAASVDLNQTHSNMGSKVHLQHWIPNTVIEVRG